MGKSSMSPSADVHEMRKRILVLLTGKLVESLESWKLLKVSTSAGPRITIQLDIPYVQRFWEHVQFSKCLGSRIVPFRKGHAVACILVAGVALDFAMHAGQSFGEVFCLLLHQRHKGQYDQRFHVILQRRTDKLVGPTLTDISLSLT